MGYNTASTEWPSSTTVPETTKSVIDTLFNLLDDSSDGVGDRLADEIFTSDGSMHGGMGKSEGTDALRTSRLNVWKLIKTRRHTVLRVYVHDAEARDLLIIGNVVMGFVNGKEVAGEFTARILFAADEEKIRLYNVWADTGPLHKMVQEVMSAEK